jgi:hypothetical protein
MEVIEAVLNTLTTSRKHLKKMAKELGMVHTR